MDLPPDWSVDPDPAPNMDLFVDWSNPLEPKVKPVLAKLPAGLFPKPVNDDAADTENAAAFVTADLGPGAPELGPRAPELGPRAPELGPRAPLVPKAPIVVAGLPKLGTPPVPIKFLTAIWAG